jgi:hypothetical protein
VIRGGRHVAVTPYLPLLSGDIVKVLFPTNSDKSAGQNRIVLSIGNQRVALDAASPPYCVACTNGKATAASPDAGTVILRNVVASLQGIFAGAQDDRYTDAAESMESRGGEATAPISVPLLAAPGQRIVAGSRALALEWKGGKPPFTVSLYRAGGAAAIETLDATARTATFPVAAIAPASYRLEIDDVAGQTAGATFEAVAPDVLPAPTPDESEVAADTSLPEDLRITLGAASLVQRAPAFGFEAYQRVAPLAASYPPAELLRYHLAEPA